MHIQISFDEIEKAISKFASVSVTFTGSKDDSQKFEIGVKDLSELGENRFTKGLYSVLGKVVGLRTWDVVIDHIWKWNLYIKVCKFTQLGVAGVNFLDQKISLLPDEFPKGLIKKVEDSDLLQVNLLAITEIKDVLQNLQLKSISFNETEISIDVELKMA